ncbi:ABC transporter ATP-binding protein [Chromobacterium haemolyticum]|uniref:ABC transporter ATP-binding protein n=1 Tax=Chromobacterium fluminis TaxID=3044269 RepID=A0ABX0L5J9_9NEIS|nr:ABC transporter ATP-binding protein [Chromobacterium haemolyticum]NHR07074.1 ABC transporter ATP-binding protein [Chromobacterium haemolyticum]OQS44518.1 heme ABC transporter ATP-binding protein [Chromobacterium haemolyticum]
MTEFAIELAGINKSFGAVKANRDVSMKIAKGTVHGVIGENGAGKSTLMSILYGYYQADSGAIRVNGKEAPIRNSQEAIELGIGMVHQHFMLVDTFTVLENIVLGAEGGLVLKKGLDEAREHLKELNRNYSLEVDPDALVGDLGVGLQQRVEILKALYRGADVLILDEPTAVLTPQEADHLFHILRSLKAQGKTVILITHKLREVMDITDGVSVMRAGTVVANVATCDVDKEKLADLMVGRKVSLKVDKAEREPGAAVLSVKNLCLTDARAVKLLDQLNFEVRAGEIVGIAGVSGNGQSELLEVLAGMLEPSAGEMVYKGEDLLRRRCGAQPRAALYRKLGIAHVPEDRSREGLVKAFSSYENAILGYHGEPGLGRGPWYSRKRLLARTRDFIQQFDIRPGNPLLRVGLLSGGNQQKVVLAREIHANPDLLLIGQPTRGVDIGAIEFIHKRLVELRDEGKAILLVSVELEEILALADRILVMAGGQITGEVAAKDADTISLGLLMGGHKH